MAPKKKYRYERSPHAMVAKKIKLFERIHPGISDSELVQKTCASLYQVMANREKPGEDTQQKILEVLRKDRFAPVQKILRAIGLSRHEESADLILDIMKKMKRDHEEARLWDKGSKAYLHDFEDSSHFPMTTLELAKATEFCESFVSRHRKTTAPGRSSHKVSHSLPVPEMFAQLKELHNEKIDLAAGFISRIAITRGPICVASYTRELQEGHLRKFFRSYFKSPEKGMLFDLALEESVKRAKRILVEQGRSRIAKKLKFVPTGERFKILVKTRKLKRPPAILLPTAEAFEHLIQLHGYRLTSAAEKMAKKAEEDGAARASFMKRALVRTDLQPFYLMGRKPATRSELFHLAYAEVVKRAKKILRGNGRHDLAKNLKAPKPNERSGRPKKK